jgi:hypothetical protein
MIDGITGPSSDLTDIQLTAATYGFHVNDRVDFLGAEGVITAITEDPHTMMRDFPIVVRLGENGDGQTLYFTADGRYLKGQNPSLVVIGKVVPKVKYWRWIYQDAYQLPQITQRYYNDQHISEDGIAASQILVQKVDCTEVERDSPTHREVER